MKAQRRLAAAALSMLIPALALAHWTAVLPPHVGADLIDGLPREVGAWRATMDQPLDAQVLAAVSPAAYAQRRYEAEGRVPIWFYVGFYSARGGAVNGAHDPRVCYPAQGWEVLEARPLELPMDGGELLNAKLLDAQRGSRRESVLFWFQPARRWPSAGLTEEILRLGDALVMQPQYAFVRLSGPTDGSPLAAADLAAFAREIAPSLREIVRRMSHSHLGGGILASRLGVQRLMPRAQ